MKKSKTYQVYRSIMPIFLLLFFAARGYCNEDISYSPDQKLKIIEDKKNIKDVFYFANGKWTNLTNYERPNTIYDYKMSSNGRYAFVWHMERSPRLLTIYDLNRLLLIRTLKLGFGGELRWNIDNDIVHVYSCGSGCSAAKVIDLMGTTLFEIAGSPIEISPSGRYLAFFTINWVGKQNFELYDLSHKYLLDHKTPLLVVTGVGHVNSILWNEEKKITLKYTDIKGSYKEIPLDLSNY